MTLPPLARPRVHHAPAGGAWMNDPVGLVRLGDDWHLFYQRADDAEGRAMGWGHAVSRDLLHWEDRGTAIAPDAAGWIYSGSTVIDVRNASGLGSDGRPPLIAFYTRHDPATGHQRQEAAFSADAQAWTRYAGNPLIDEGRSETRDPFLFAYDDGWRVLVAEPVAWTNPDVGRSGLALYASDDLMTWQQLGLLGIEGEPGVMFETPALLPLAVPGEAQTWLLIVGTVDRRGDGAACATRAWTGRFDGRDFTPDAPWQPLDFGPDFYAAAPWAGLPSGEVMVTAWANSWAYARRLPGDDWRGGAHALPRRIEARRGPDGSLVVGQRPAALPEGDEVARFDGPIGTPTDLGPMPMTARIDLRYDLGGADRLSLALDDGEDRLTVTLRRGEASLERLGRKSDAVGGGFAGRWTMPLAGDGAGELTLLLDGLVAELFADGRAMTAVAWRGPHDRLRLDGPGARCRCTVAAIA